MTKEKFKIVLSDAWDAGEGDTYTEDQLIESAQQYIADQVTGHLTDDQEQEVIESYRAGFMGYKVGEEKPEVKIEKLKKQLKKARADARYYKELYEYNNEEM